MKIGILLRHYEQHPGGVMNYTFSLLDLLLQMGKDHEFVLIYRNPALIGNYRKFPNVREIAYRAPNLLVWDQIVVPWIERREKFDVLFNPKWSMPLLVNSPQVFVCHGLDWYAMPWGSPPLYRLTHKYLIPRIADNASSIICVSHSTARDAKRFLNVPDEKLQVIYHGIGESFLEPISAQLSESVRRKYDLPDRYILYVGQVYPAKNFDRLIKAYGQIRDETGIHLVVAGQHTFMCEKQMDLPENLGISDSVHFIGWIEHDELPALYQNAVALALPSLYEACPSPILEAMAVGCPVVTGNRTGMSEIAGGAAYEVDPDDVGSIADGMREVVSDAKLRVRLRQAGLEWVKHFSWEKCAAQTLEAILDTGRRAAKTARSAERPIDKRALRDNQ